MMSVCGVLCSDCPAYDGSSKGLEHQRRVADAWHRIYDLKFSADQITCGGCFGSDADLFCTMGSCAARICCRSKGFESCAQCPEDDCAALEKAQAAWDEVPDLIGRLSPEDFEIYAEPYCGHRQRLAAARVAFWSSSI